MQRQQAPVIPMGSCVMQVGWGPLLGSTPWSCQGKGQKPRGGMLPQHLYRWAREWQTSPGGHKASFVSVLQLLATFSEALRLLENSNGCYLFLRLYPGCLGSLKETQTPPSHPCSHQATQLLLPETRCARAGLGRDSHAWKMGGIGSLQTVSPGSVALPFAERGAEEKQISLGLCGLWHLEEQKTNQPSS